MGERFTREQLEEITLEEISERIKQGYYSGITGYGVTWSLDVNDEDYDEILEKQEEE